MNKSVLLRIIAFIALFCVATREGFGQQRFQAGIIAGLTASQIDGDRSAGYNKIGYQAGLRGVVILPKKQRMSIELMYTQRGAQSALIRSAGYADFSLTNNFIEVPVQWHYLDWLDDTDEDNPFYKVQLNAGLAYGYLISSKVDDEGSAISTVIPKFNKNDVSFVCGVTFFTGPHFGLSFRYTKSLGLLYDAVKNDGKPFATSWHPHNLCFQGQYIF